MKKWMVGAGLFLLLLTILIWGMVSAPILSNYPWSIELRKQLHSVIYPKIGLDYKSLPFGIMPMLKAKDEESYVYTLLGKVVGVDTNERVLKVQVKRGEIYGVKYGSKPGMDLRYRVKEGEGWRDLVHGREPLGVDAKIMVQWSDARKLTEILESARADGEQKMVNPNWSQQDYLRIIKLE